MGTLADMRQLRRWQGLRYEPSPALIRAAAAPQGGGARLLMGGGVLCIVGARVGDPALQLGFMKCDAAPTQLDLGRELLVGDTAIDRRAREAGKVHDSLHRHQGEDHYALRTILHLGERPEAGAKDKMIDRRESSRVPKRYHSVCLVTVRTTAYTSVSGRTTGGMKIFFSR